MVAGGVPSQRADHAQAVADLALAMRETSRSMATPAGKSFALRIGIHTGPVVAGVIGEKKFSYNLWGDAVNLANRLESRGQPDRIQISDRTRQLLTGSFHVESRGLIDIKGKGPTSTWWLNGRMAPGS